MPAIEDVLQFVQEIAPPQLAEDWDNNGLLVRCGDAAERILVTLDITMAVVAEAQRLGCNLIVAHHPVIFSPLRSIGEDDVAYALVKAGISAICAHTPLDAAEGGVNDALAETLGLQEVKELPPLGRVGTLPQAMTPEVFAAHCAKVLKAPVQLANAGREVATVALVGGAGKEFLADAVAAGADCFVTGEAGHHTALDALAAGVSLVVAGHWATEHPVVPRLAQRLREKFDGVGVFESEEDKDPYQGVYLVE